MHNFPHTFGSRLVFWQRYLQQLLQVKLALAPCGKNLFKVQMVNTVDRSCFAFD